MMSLGVSDTESGNFVTTVPLATTPRDEAVLAKRFDAACSAYNALLGECLRRSRLMRESKAWAAARRMPKGKPKSDAYRELAVRFGFREYDLYQFIRTMRAGVDFHTAETPQQVSERVKGRVGYIGTHLDSHAVMAMARRAFRAAQRAIFERAKVRFKRRSEFRSIEGTSSKSALKWHGQSVKWCGLILLPKIDAKDAVLVHGINSDVRMTRIVRMSIRGKTRYFAQLISAGRPFKKPNRGSTNGVVGLDIGPSTIAIVGPESASLERFANEVVDAEAEVRRIQRRADRQQRTGNPDCFDEKGRWIKGKRATHISKALRRTRRKVAELRRCQQAHRKNLHGRLAHRVLSLGDDVRTEKLSYRSFQRSFGKSVGIRGPGEFIATLKRSASKYDATVTEFNTLTTRLSQTCVCGKVKKKLLSERTHRCDCGVTAQRDLFSAYLARQVSENRLDVGRAREGWPAHCNVLDTASKAYQRGDDRASCRDHRETGGAASCSDIQRKPVSATDVVAPLDGVRAAEKPVESDHAFLLGSRRRRRKQLSNQDLQSGGLNQ